MSRPTAVVVDRTGLVRDRSAVARFVRGILQAENSAGQVVVAFVTEEEMVDLNLRFRGRAEPTDVLSFPCSPGEIWPGERAELGEVAVCPSVVCRYSCEDGVSLSTQLAWTLVHGVLHLLGYDHETDHGEMRSREREILAELSDLVSSLALAERGQ